jgi:sirohydrochlorin ferrochelatase
LKERVAEHLPNEAVEVAFMQFDGPNLPEVVEAAAQAGHGTFHLLPLFMASAGHVDKDIKPLVTELSETHPELELTVLTPVGEDPLFPRVIADIVSGPSAES